MVIQLPYVAIRYDFRECCQPRRTDDHNRPIHSFIPFRRRLYVWLWMDLSTHQHTRLIQFSAVTDERKTCGTTKQRWTVDRIRRSKWLMKSYWWFPAFQKTWFINFCFSSAWHESTAEYRSVRFQSMMCVCVCGRDAVHPYTLHLHWNQRHAGTHTQVAISRYVPFNVH